MKIKSLIVATACAMFVTACGSSSDSPNTGKLALAVTDAPVDEADAVVVEFTGVEIQGQGARLEIDFDAPKQIDLLALTGSDSMSLLPATDLPAGSYQWIRLKVNALKNVTDSYIDTAEGRFSIYIPSGAETGLKLNRPFNIAQGSRTDFTLDFDLRKSVHNPGNNSEDYVLRPTIRVVDNLEIGHISGTVADALVTDTAVPCGDTSAVYLFDGFDAEADDIDGIDLDPVTTALVEINQDSVYDYEVGFVEAGEYTVAFTCQAADEDPATDDAIVFSAQQNVTVTTGDTVTADF